MGAICLGERVMESGCITKGVHGSTFGGNPLACAAALTTLDILEQEDLPARAAELGAYALERLRGLQSPLIREVRGRGILALPAGPNVLRLLPPLVITREQLDRVIDVIADLLGAPAQSVQSIPESSPALVSSSAEVALLHSMLTIPSLSRQEGALARYLTEQAQLAGLHSYVDEAGNFVASTYAELGDEQPVVLLGHMDTVPGTIPVRLEDGILYGRGAVDAKGPLAAFLCAAARVARTGRVTRPIVVVGAVEEEAATSRGARAVVERYQPYACIIGEPSSSQAVTIGYKGRLLIDGCVTVPLSHTAGPAQSSNEIAVSFWERVRQHADEWNQQHAGTSTFAALMPSLRSINSSQDGLEEQTYFFIGYRLPPDFDIAGLRTQLQRWALEDNIHLRFSGEEVAYQSTRSTPLARAFISAIRSTGAQPTFKHKTGTSDMNVVAPTWGQNIVAYGPGDSRLDHTPQEHIQVAEYAHAIDVLELVLQDVANQRETAL
jgi:N-acetyl-ornithine/N-acetyl-lysine deacetylase